MLTRFAGLPPEALDTARAASVLGSRFRPASATKMAGVPERQIERIGGMRWGASDLGRTESGDIQHVDLHQP